MTLLETRSQFTLRDPDALAALLLQDWRTRAFLTDEDMIEGVVDQPLTTALLRHLQRLGYVNALHGVRSRGGRMRLWSVSQALKIQAALDLRAASGASLSACVEALGAPATGLDALAERWRDHVGQAPEPAALQAAEAPDAHLLEDSARLAAFARASIAAFVVRNRFDEAPRPAFLI